MPSAMVMLSHLPFLYLIALRHATATSVDRLHVRLPAPPAPTFVTLASDKRHIMMILPPH